MTLRAKPIVGHFNFDKKLLPCPGCGPIISYDSSVRNGDTISCNHCNYEFRMHKKEDGFEIENIMNYNPLKKSNGDRDVINEFSSAFVDKIQI